MNVARIVEADENNHVAPAGADEHWQESCAIGWYDPLTRMGGWHHLGFARVRHMADLWSCVWERSQFVHRQQNLTLPIPQGDITDIELGALSVRTIEPLVEHHLTIADPDKGLSVKLTCRRTIDPVTFSYSAAKGHWEVYGAFQGEVITGSSTTKVRGHSFIDRSWGTRVWSEILTYRLVWASFGDDLAFKLYTMRFKTGPQIFGFVISDGRRTSVRHVEIDPLMGPDGVNPKAATVTAWTEDGRAYKIQGICDGSDVGVQRGGFMCGHANATFECGGRLGTGFIEVQELKQPPHWDEELRRMLPPDADG